MNKPILSTDNEQANKWYFLKFNGNHRILSDINLNTISGQSNVCNVFVYRLKANDASNYWTCNGLMGNDNG